MRRGFASQAASKHTEQRVPSMVDEAQQSVRKTVSPSPHLFLGFETETEWKRRGKCESVFGVYHASSFELSSYEWGGGFRFLHFPHAHAFLFHPNFLISCCAKGSRYFQTEMHYISVSL